MSADIAANEIDKLQNELAYRRRVMEFQEYQGFILVNLMTKAQLDAYDDVAERAPRGTSYKDINDTIKQVRKERGI